MVCCWGGVGHVLRFTCELAHEVDATLWLSLGACIHGWGLGWGVIITSLALSHIRHVTLLRSLGFPRRRHATLLSVLLDFHAYLMLRYVRSLGLPHIRSTSSNYTIDPRGLILIIN